jgi:glutamate-ammonia-ligase adenylyltransferase
MDQSLTHSGDWPPPGDRAAAADLRQAFAALGPAQAAGVGEAAAIFDAIGGNSPYLAAACLRESATLLAVLRDGPDAVFTAELAALAAADPGQPRARIASALRAAKLRCALVIAIADIGRLWTLPRVTAALSDLAETALNTAVTHLLVSAHHAREPSLKLPYPNNPMRACGFVVLGMGKLGGRELNYSSDIDLVVIYDPRRHQYSGDALGSVFTRLTRDLVTLMEQRDADGYVFRTDLRLRPDPSATPPAISLAAALTYYESMGQNWERAAMIKARPVAGDLPLGWAFLEAIRPFIWRRHLDFAAIADIQAMKARIDAQRGSRLPVDANPPGLLGYDIKLGQGGIREIEFFAQTLQMVWGGQDPSLRTHATLPALEALARADRLRQATVPELGAAYRLLRDIEHRLQMVEDRQTHHLPARLDELERFAVFMGFGDAAALADRLVPVLHLVHARFAGLLRAEPSRDEALPAPAPFTPAGEDWSDLAFDTQLAGLGFTNITGMRQVIGGWQAGHPRALRSDRARALLRELLPALLGMMAKQAAPDATFFRFDHFIASLPAGVQLLSLFQRNPALLERVIGVLGAAPLLAEHLAGTPSAIEGLLAPDAPERIPLRLLLAQLRGTSALDEALAVLRRFVRGEDFRLSVATLEGRLNADRAGVARTRLAEAALNALLPRVLADFASRYGTVPGGSLALVALGKAGSRDMLPGSDLDLMLIYDHPDAISESVGGKPLPASTWFIRAAHAVVAALTAPGAEGPLYAVDMRLRPSGNKGPVAVSFAGFVRYHREDAWTWERMALTRARVVAGPSHFRRRLRAALSAALDHAGPPETILADAAAMRGRLARDLPATGPWDTRARAGGLLDVEFIAQALQLASANPAVRDPTPRIALQRLADHGALSADDAACLINAEHVWRSVQGLLRLTVGRITGPHLPDEAVAALRRVLGEDLDEAAMLRTLDTMAQQVRALFIRHVGRPEDENELKGRR